MRVGIPAEVKNNETRVAITPAGVREFVEAGHDVIDSGGSRHRLVIRRRRLRRSGREDRHRRRRLGLRDGAQGQGTHRVGIRLLARPASRSSRTSTSPRTSRSRRRSSTPDCVSIAYETVQLADGSLPLLAPMSEVAGRMATLVGAYHLMSSQGGRGVLASGVPGVRPAKVAVIGAGVSGAGALAQAVGMGCDVTVLDTSIPRLRQLDALYGGAIKTVVSSAHEIEVDVPRGRHRHRRRARRWCPRAQASSATRLVAAMKPGSVLVDIAIDQGGCFEDSHATTHAEPTYKVENSVFYCVANMPGAVGLHLDGGPHQRDPPVRARPREPRLGGGHRRQPRPRQGPRRGRRSHRQCAHGHRPSRTCQPRSCCSRSHTLSGVVTRTRPRVTRSVVVLKSFARAVWLPTHRKPRDARRCRDQTRPRSTTSSARPPRGRHTRSRVP